MIPGSRVTWLCRPTMEPEEAAFRLLFVNSSLAFLTTSPTFNNRLAILADATS